MNKIILTIGFALSFLFPKDYTAHAQDEAEKVYRYVEQMPEYPGGITRFQKYIVENLVFPQEAKESAISGKVFVAFMIRKDGKVDSVYVARGVHPLLDEEAVRVVKKSPPWIPGRKEGKRVNVWFTIPINFKFW